MCNAQLPLLRFFCNVSPSEEFELTANSLGARMKFPESSPGMGHGEIINLACSVLTR